MLFYKLFLCCMFCSTSCSCAVCFVLQVVLVLYVLFYKLFLCYMFCSTSCSCAICFVLQVVLVLYILFLLHFVTIFGQVIFVTWIFCHFSLCDTSTKFKQLQVARGRKIRVDLFFNWSCGGESFSSKLKNCYHELKGWFLSVIFTLYVFFCIFYSVKGTKYRNLVALLFTQYTEMSSGSYAISWSEWPTVM